MIKTWSIIEKPIVFDIDKGSQGKGRKIMAFDWEDSFEIISGLYSVSRSSKDGIEFIKSGKHKVGKRDHHDLIFFMVNCSRILKETHINLSNSSLEFSTESQDVKAFSELTNTNVT